MKSWFQKQRIRRLNRTIDLLEDELELRRTRAKPFDTASEFTNDICIEMREREIVRLKKQILQLENFGVVEEDLT